MDDSRETKTIAPKHNLILFLFFFFFCAQQSGFFEVPSATEHCSDSGNRCDISSDQSGDSLCPL